MVSGRMKVAGLAIAAVLIVAATTYVFTAPYSRTAGVRIGGRTTPPPADFTNGFKPGVGLIKTGGFPPFVVRVVLVPFKGGFITATRPDGGYWSKRARLAPAGYVRTGDTTFAMKATGAFSLTYKTSEHSVEELLDRVRAAGIAIKDLSIEEPDLEDVFVELTT